MLYFIYTDLISSLLERLVDPGSTLIYVGAYDPIFHLQKVDFRTFSQTFQHRRYSEENAINSAVSL